jgi:hypothetical protein
LIQRFIFTNDSIKQLSMPYGTTWLGLGVSELPPRLLPLPAITPAVTAVATPAKAITPTTPPETYLPSDGTPPSSFLSEDLSATNTASPVVITSAGLLNVLCSPA